jgi:hypothetical protein
MFFLGQKNGKTVFLALKHGEQKHQVVWGKASVLFHSLPHASACGLLGLLLGLALLLLRSACK